MMRRAGCDRTSRILKETNAIVQILGLGGRQAAAATLAWSNYVIPDYVHLSRGYTDSFRSNEAYSPLSLRKGETPVFAARDGKRKRRQRV